jgi:hypothetical protein
MSWGTCYKASNNIHQGFPALMSEGNYVTDWNSACKINDELKKRAGIRTNYQYRQYLINNADNLIQKDQVDACAACCGCLQNFHSRPNSQKYLFKSCSDHKTPFGYETSDLKNMYLSSQVLQERLVAPILTQSQMLQRPNWN